MIIKIYLNIFSSTVPKFPGTPSNPTPGCWIYLPSGCSGNSSTDSNWKPWKQSLENTYANRTNFDTWIPDPYTPTFSSKFTIREFCEDTRKTEINDFCKVNYTKMKYIGK